MKELKSRTVASGLGFTEGPTLRADGELVVVSISHGKLYRISGGTTTVLAHTGGGPNGATEAADGTIFVAQNGGRWGGTSASEKVTGGIQRVSRDGTVGWVTQDPIAPNDLCFGPDGLLYITDPTRFRHTRDDGRLFRCNVASGECELLCSVPWYPNGIGFGLEDDALYVARTGEGSIMRIPLDGGKLGKPETFVQMGFGLPDGFLFDVEGNLTTTALSINAGDRPGELQTYDRNGKLIDTFVPGTHKKYTNVALGPDRTLYITDSEGGNVLAVADWPTAGLALHPARGSARA